MHATWMLKRQNLSRNHHLRRSTLINSALPGAVRCALASYYMARRAVSCIVAPNAGFSSQDGSKIVLRRWGCSTLNFSKSVNSFCEPVFFYRFLGSRLSIGGVKSQNEFVTKALTCTKGRFHETKISKFGAQTLMFCMTPKT